MKIILPDLSLVLLVGTSGSGKSTFARKHFKATEIVSSDTCRGLVSDDETDQSATKDAFELVHFIAAKRLAAGKLTVIDATNVQPEARRSLLALAKQYHSLVTAIVFNIPEKLCHERNKSRPDRHFGPHVIRLQSVQLRKSLSSLREEGFHNIYTLHSPEQFESVEIERQRLWCNLKSEHAPFDIIGDVHGCFDELHTLLTRLGYSIERQGEPERLTFQVRHPEGRRVVFLGDLVDRGPATPDVLRLVMDMVAEGGAFCVPGNHDMKLLRKLKGKNVALTHGIAETLQQLEPESAEFKERVRAFLEARISHYVLDDGKLVVAHAGMKESMQGRGSGAVRQFAQYGETTGETDEFGLPVRYNWASEYRGKAMVVYGHTPVAEPEWLNNTINIDTGCVFGGQLTALRYPERRLVSVPAQKTYCEPVKPLDAVKATISMQQTHDDILDIEDVTGKRIIETRLQSRITIREENSIAALEVMSRFAANPKWLIYLPPTMSPSETSQEAGLLEHPAEVFAYFRDEGVEKVVCEEKHMGSRAIVVLCRNEDVARKRFGIENEGIGICYTRTGRRFFDDRALESELLKRVATALEATAFWEKMQTDWVCLDCELMPWSVKAQALVLKQYAAVGAATRTGLKDTMAALGQAVAHGLDTQGVFEAYQQRQQLANRYVEAYRHYCWPVTSIDDLKLAPFHILATQGMVHIDKDHLWHMRQIAEFCAADPKLLLATTYRIVDLHDAQSVEQGVAWWQEMTGRGGEGMVVKPLDFIVRGARGVIQPAVKCRGSEYLRIIYGPEYDVPANLQRLRSRGLGAKRSLALREFALGIEALERFVQEQPLRRVHECVFGVLALESEPVDPRL